MIIYKSLHVASDGIISFFIMVEQYCIECMDHSGYPLLCFLWPTEASHRMGPGGQVS